MLSKLALRNVKRQVGNYLIYFMTVSFTVAMLFAISNVIFSENLSRFTAISPDTKNGLIGVVVIISIIISFVLSYATSFMLKLRKREFGTYLTLGMTRKNILIIFISETMIIGVSALVIGLIIGLFLYQGLMVIMMNLLEMQFSIAAYSVKGVILTVGLVIGIFILASLFSAVYLMKVSIYDLIHASQKVERAVKHPIAWFVFTIISLIILISSLYLFNYETENVLLKGDTAGEMFLYIFIFAVSIIIFHIGLAKSIICILLKRKKFSNRGTNTFVFRQLSGTLNTNAIMMGFLAFLLAFAIIGSNIAFAQKATQETVINQACPFDIRYTGNENDDPGEKNSNTGIPADEAESIIQKYVKIENKYQCALYTTNENDFYSRTRWTGEGYEGLTDSFMKLSDFNMLLKAIGYEEISLDNEFFIVTDMPEVEKLDWSTMVYERNGQSYEFGNVSMDYPRFSSGYFYVVLPDEAVRGMDIETDYVFYDTEDKVYDAVALEKDLTYLVPSRYYNDGTMIERCDYLLRESVRQEENGINAILVVGALFAATIFLFMAMAILALKTLSTLSEDKQRYQILYRLGAGASEQGKALFHQTFSFFILPFAVPLLVSIPTAIICQHIMKMAGMDILIQQIPIIAAVIAGVMALIYLLYYGATYFIAKRVIVTPIIK